MQLSTRKRVVQTAASKKPAASMTKRSRMTLYRNIKANAFSGPFPATKKAQLVYADVVSMPFLSSAGNYIFSANGLFDPDQISGVAKQPLYFDQIMAIYNHYVVTSSVIEWQFVTQGNGRDFFVVAYIDDDASLGTGLQTDAERPGARSLVVSPSVTTAPTITQYWSAERTFGPNVMNNSLFRGTATTNPTEQSFFVFKAEDLAGTLTTAVQVRVKVTYNVTFTEFKTIASS